MRVKDLIKELSDVDPEMEVALRITLPDDSEDEYPYVSDVIGEYCEVADERSVSVEYGKPVLVGDLPGV